MISLSDLGVSFGPVPALAGVSLEVGAGEWLGLIGPNGAGKTTLLRAIAGLQSHEGLVSVDGADLARLSPRRRARKIAYLPQDPERPSEMTVFDYVLLGRTPHIGYFGTERASDFAVAASLLERLGLGRLAERRLETLSGGELHRVVLCRALAQEAPVLLLDEPTSDLDLGRRMEVLELVEELREERRLTVVSAMHDLSLAAQFAERLVLVAAGQVVADGLPAEVLDEELLASHFGGPVRVMTTADGELVVVPRRSRSIAPPL